MISILQPRQRRGISLCSLPKHLTLSPLSPTDWGLQLKTAGVGSGAKYGHAEEGFCDQNSWPKECELSLLQELRFGVSS